MENYNQYLEYAENVGCSDQVILWCETTLKNHLEKNTIEIAEVEHVLDYLSQNEVKALHKMSYPQALIKTDKWTKKLQKQAEKIVEKPSDIKVSLDFKDGFKIVELVGKRAYEREGLLMRHCSASYFGKDEKLYSLRDKYNNPHATLSSSSQQIKGKGNGSIHPRYVKHVVEFLESQNIAVRDSEMEKLGYVNIEEIQDKNAVFKDLFRDKYFYKENRILDKKGEPYQSLSLWGKFKLFDLDAKLNIKWHFDIDLSVKTFISHISRFKKATNTGNMSASTNTGDGSASTNTGDMSASTNTGYSSASTNTGNMSASTNTGDRSASTNTGNMSASTNTGHRSASTNTGDMSASTNTGNMSASTNTGNMSASTN